MSLESLPYDISRVIYSLACSDGGRTGAALARVSRAVRTASAEHVYESVALSGFYQASNFARAAAKRARKARRPVPPIYDLFLCTQCPCAALSGDLYPRKDAWDALQDAVVRLAAPTVRTLALVMYDAPALNLEHIVRLLVLPLPRLQELTLRGQWVLPTLSLLPSGSLAMLGRPLEALDGDANRPRLRRVHLAAGRSLADDLHWHLLRQLSPDITHLRLSVLVKGHATCVARLLHAEYAKRGLLGTQLELTWLTLGDNRVCIADPVQLSARPVLPPRLELLLVQPPPGTIRLDEYDILDSLKMINILKAIEREIPGGAFVFVPLHTARAYGWQEAIVDWEDRITGGDGCWVERPESDALPDDSDAPPAVACVEHKPRHQDCRTRWKTLFRAVTKGLRR